LLLVGCRHVYQFSKVFVGDPSLSRSASSSALCTSSPRVAVTTASLLPSPTCLVSDRVMSSVVPASSPSDVTPSLLTCPLVWSPSSPSSCRDSSMSSPGLPENATSLQVQSTQVPVKPVSCAAGCSSRLQEFQVRSFQNCESGLHKYLTSVNNF